MTNFSRETRKKQERIIPFYFFNHLGGFLLIGIITTCTDVGFLWLLTEKLGLWYLASSAISYCTGAILSFLLNKSLNYRNQSREYFKQGSSFLVIATSSFALNLAIISLGVEILSLNYLVAKILATGIAFFWNYYGQSTVTFRIWN